MSDELTNTTSNLIPVNLINKMPTICVYNVGKVARPEKLGSVLDQELAAYYAACDVFLMPNRQIGADREGFGMVYLEAGAAGKPIQRGRGYLRSRSLASWDGTGLT